jgi:peptidoglycan hydrolase-like protein with peptidoglycan-binding domain
MKIIKLNEADLEKIVRKVLNKQIEANVNPKNLKFGDKGEDVSKLQQRLIDLKFLTLKDGPTGYFGPKTQAALAKAEGKPIPTTNQDTNKPTQKSTKTPTQEVGGCPSVGNSPYFRDLPNMVAYWKKSYPELKTDQQVISLIDRMINRDAQLFKQTIPAISQEGACQIASVGRRPQYDSKNIFIVDSPNKRVFLFSGKDKNGARPFIAQDIIIDGKDKQRNDAVSVANAFRTYGMRYSQLKKKLKREPTEDEVFATWSEENTRFLPAGIYTGSRVYTDKTYQGGTNNVLELKNWLGNYVSNALHGYYKGDARAPFMAKALSIVKNPNNPEEIDKFTEEMENSGLKMDFSYGCINLPPRFIKYLEQYGGNSFIFNIAEDNTNYLVQNTENFFDKMQNSESCPSPKSLGAMDMSSMA